MKIRITFLSMLAVSTALVASAQVVEYDDMYFNSKDRTVIMASKPLTIKNIASQSYEVKTAINPTDSYSARNVNPEYISQSTVNPSGTSEPAPYFTPDYSPVAINQNLNTNATSSWNNCNCGSSGFYPNYGMMPGGFGGMYGSYYPSMYGYNPYSSFGGYNGFYNSGWSSMMGMGFGMGMGNFGMGGFGMGGYYPWGGSPFYNSFYGSNFYNGFGYYPNNVIIINNGGDNSNYRVAYSKRTSRSNDLNNPVSLNNRSTSTSMVTTDTQGRVRGANGRVSGDNNSGTNTYYQRGWRANPDTNSSGGTSWGNSTRSGNDSGFTNRSNPNTSNSRSSFNNNSLRSGNTSGGSNFSSGGGASRSSGGSTGGSSSGGSRGRD